MFGWFLAAACAPPAECDAAFDLASADFPFGDAVARLELSLSAEARAALPEAPRDIGADVRATLVHDGRAWTVGVNLKGNSSFRPIDGKPSFKIDVGEFLPGSTFHGVRRLTLNSLVDDRSGLAGAMTYALYQRAGLPAPRQSYACLTVDDEEYGLYALVETLDEAFLERAFVDPSGWLYDRRGDADFTLSQTSFFEVEEEGPDGERDDLIALATRLDDAPDLLPELERSFDADALLSGIAIDLAMASTDGYAMNANNFLVYHEPGPDRWWLLPWGVDQALGAPASEVRTESNAGGLLAQRCLAEADCAARLDAELLALADPLAELEAEARELGARLETLPDPRAETSATDRWFAREDAYGFLAARPGALRGR